jgi:molybdate transport system ATP-binding protein
VADTPLRVGFRQAGPIPLDVAFDCARGDVLAVFGPSGSGKTTILRAIAGLYRPADAVVRSGNRTWCDTAAGIDVPAHQRAVGMVFQDYALFPHLTARGNVLAALGHRPAAQRRARADELLALVHLDALGERRPAALSGGERQRVALARAIARDPAVLLLDEPFAAVDRPVRRRLQDEVDALRRRLDMPVVLVTHDFDDVVRLASHVLLLDRGRTVASGPIADVMRRADLPWLRDAVGLGAVFDAQVARLDHERGLATLDIGGPELVVPAAGIAPGASVRARVPAREVILATQAPAGLSLHNVLPGAVTEIHHLPGTSQAIVQVQVGARHLLAEVTGDAVSRLALTIGAPVHALVKSVSIDLHVVS